MVMEEYADKNRMYSYQADSARAGRDIQPRNRKHVIKVLSFTNVKVLSVVPPLRFLFSQSQSKRWYGPSQAFLLPPPPPPPPAKQSLQLVVAIDLDRATFFQLSSGTNSRIHTWYKLKEFVYCNLYKPCISGQLELESRVYVVA